MKSVIETMSKSGNMSLKIQSNILAFRAPTEYGNHENIENPTACVYLTWNKLISRKTKE